MFTGIITHTGIILSAKQNDELRLTFTCDFAPELTIGESVAVNGCCLTVADIQANSFAIDMSDETIGRTAPYWNQGSRVNFERSLKLGNRLDGHLVTGHVDGVATITGVKAQGGSHILTLEAPKELARFIAEKGSVTLDGISLTVNDVKDNIFTVNIIPHTWNHTTLAGRKTSDGVNLEVDLMARYAARLLAS
ncbi:MAG: riboflavin synthase [Alphaproteobacteria bacterium]